MVGDVSDQGTRRPMPPAAPRPPTARRASTAPPIPDQLRPGVVIGVAAYVIWGSLTVYWKQLHHFDAFEVIAWRVCSASVVMALVLTVAGRWNHLRPVLRSRALLGRVALAAAALAVNWTAYVYAVVHGRVLEGALGYFIAPLFTIAAGVVVLRERLNLAQRAAAGFGIASLAVLTWSYGRVPWLALTIGAAWTVYGYLKRNVPLHPVESMAAEAFVLVVPALVLVVAMAGASTSIPSAASPTELTLALLSGVVTIIPLTMFAAASQRVPLTVLAPTQYLIPTINLLLGWLVYHESMSASRLAGFALVWVGLVLVTADMARRTRAVATVA